MKYAMKFLPTAVIASAVMIVAAPGQDAGTGDAVAVGRAYAPVLAKTYADSWERAADALEGGKTVAESQRVLQDTWKVSREEAFDLRVTPALSKVLAEGREPANPTERRRVAAFWRDFARGLKRGK